VSVWTDPAWRAEADGWIGEQLAGLGLAVSGELDQLHVYPWSTVIRVPISGGDVYFKANTDALLHEAALVELLAERRPDSVPPLLAVDPARGWMLMADAGAQLRELVARERDLSRWLDVLPIYASLQLDLADAAERLVALGVPDLRLSGLAAGYEGMLDDVVGLPAHERRRLVDAVGLVEEMCGELAAHGVPETIQHDDLHDGQVYVRNGSYRLLDWGDACVSHPFFTMAVTLEGVIAWGVDDVQGSVDPAPFRAAYLEPFARSEGDADLEAACAIAVRLGWVCRALNGHLSGSAPAETGTRLRMFLDGHP
jgi:hypothetical protein